MWAADRQDRKFNSESGLLVVSQTVLNGDIRMPGGTSDSVQVFMMLKEKEFGSELMTWPVNRICLDPVTILCY